ncbi:MAG: hypothetical protein ACOC1O_01940 [bacterium]
MLTKSEIRTKIKKNRSEVNRLLRQSDNSSLKSYADKQRKIKELTKKTNELKEQLEEVN